MHSRPGLTRREVLIIGAGHAGAHAAITLRKKGFAGSIELVGQELPLPYDRPSLSKQYLLGSVTANRLAIQDAAYWQAQSIDLSMGTSVIGIDAARSVADLSNGRRIRYQHCILAAGGYARALTCPGSDLAGIHSVRTIEDVDRIRADLKPAAPVVIVGAGYVGLETAAALRTLGHPVTVVESQDRVLARVTGPCLARFIETTHRAKGVDIRLRQQVAAIEGSKRIEAIRLQSGERIPADLAIVGIGMIPRTELAEQAGLRCDSGVLVDSVGRSSVSTIFAIGDCSRHPNRFAGGLWRLESVQHATSSAEVVVEAILGKELPYEIVPTFWSDQYDLRIQSAGILHGNTETVVRGDRSTAPFSLFYLDQGRVIAMDCVNSPKDFMGGRSLIQQQIRVESARLADASVPIRQIIGERRL